MILGKKICLGFLPGHANAKILINTILLPCLKIIIISIHNKIYFPTILLLVF